VQGARPPHDGRREEPHVRESRMPEAEELCATGPKARLLRGARGSRMIDVVNKRCIEPGGCEFGRTFGIPGGKATHCKTHKKPSMVDVVHPKCLKEGCPHIPSFGLEWGKATHCKTHKPSGAEDVVSRRCAREGCDVINPSFGLEWGKATHCAIHKPPGAEDVTHPRCAREGCDVINPSFGPPGAKTGTHCDVHKPPGHANLRMDPCSSCGLPHFIKKGAMCFTCDPLTKKHRNTREELIIEFLADRFPGLGYRHDWGLPDRFCSEVRSRPDFFFDCLTHAVVLEVDQFQHLKGDYTEGCELARQYSIVAAIGLPVRFIRYNPDAFSVDGKRVRAGPATRHKVLEKELTAALAIPPEAGGMINVMHLFYDCIGPYKRPVDGFAVDETAVIAERFDELMREGVIRTRDF
jgi:hypothetical protein